MGLVPRGSRDKENKNPMGSTGDLNAESRHILRMKASQERREQSKRTEKERPGYGKIWQNKLTSPKGPNL